jgi:DNA polymerase-3 subunit alpha (Gram-positive type)
MILKKELNFYTLNIYKYMLYPVNFIVSDLETGGFSAEKNPITEIALVVVDINLNIIQEYETLVKPYGDLVIEKQALEVTKMDLNEINNGKDSKQVVLELIDIFKPLKAGKYTKPIFVGHNFEFFDLKFFIKLFEFHNKDLFDYIDKHVEDTMWISRKKWGHDNLNADFKLTTCCNRAGVEHVQAHRALPDTKATAKLFINLMKSLRSEVNGNKIVKEESVRDKFVF